MAIQASIFGGLHISQGVVGATAAGVIGLVLGSLHLITGRSLWAGIVLHGVIDTVSVTLLFLQLPKT